MRNFFAALVFIALGVAMIGFVLSLCDEAQIRAAEHAELSR